MLAEYRGRSSQTQIHRRQENARRSDMHCALAGAGHGRAAEGAEDRWAHCLIRREHAMPLPNLPWHDNPQGPQPPPPSPVAVAAKWEKQLPKSRGYPPFRGLSSPHICKSTLPAVCTPLACPVRTACPPSRVPPLPGPRKCPPCVPPARAVLCVPRICHPEDECCGSRARGCQGNRLKQTPNPQECHQKERRGDVNTKQTLRRRLTCAARALRRSNGCTQCNGTDPLPTLRDPTCGPGAQGRAAARAPPAVCAHL